MAVDMFLNLGDKIKGETQDSVQKKKGDMDILAWSWGMSQSGTLHSGGGGTSGVASIQDISVTKWIDVASPKIMLACCKGSHIPKAVLLVRKAAGDKQEKNIEITMEPVIIASVSTGGSGGEDRLTENITLNFGKVKFEFFKQDSAGAVASAGELAWDIAAKAPA